MESTNQSPSPQPLESAPSPMEAHAAEAPSGDAEHPAAQEQFHLPVNMPADRSAMIERANAADDGCISAGAPSPRGQDTFVPGLWKCSTCGFVQQNQTLYVGNGSVGVSDEDATHPDLCPNDGLLMERVTWKEHAEEAVKSSLAWAERAIAAEKKLAASAPSPMEAHAAEAMTASGDAEIVATLSNGCTLYRQCNEVGGYRYTSDEIGGGVVVWDTSLVNETTLRKALEVECREAGKTNPVLPGDKLPLTSGDAEADAVIAMDRAAKLLEKSAEPFDSACRILRDFVHAFTVRRLGNPLGGDPYAQKMTGGDAERRVVEAAKVYVKAIRDTGIDDEEQSRRYGILEEAVDALAQPTPAEEKATEPTPDVWTASTDGEAYMGRFSSRDEAIADLGGRAGYVGTIQEIGPGDLRGHIAAARVVIQRAEELARLHGFTEACSELRDMQYAMNHAENSIPEDARDA